MDEGWVERDGVRLHYLHWRPAGPAREPALLLLHGLSSNARVWERMARCLPERRIVALDQRSHGLSDRPSSGHGLDELVADAANAVRELELGRPLVGGHSWGAAVALALTAEHPDLTAGLVFVDGPAASFSRSMTWEQAAAIMQPPLPSYGDLAAAAAAHQHDLGEAWADDLVDFVRAGLVQSEPGGFVPTLTTEVRREIIRDLYDFQPELLFAEVQGPILMAMAGRLWPGAPADFAERRGRAVDEVVELRPDAQVRWYDSRHDVPLIRPGELAEDVRRTALASRFWAVARDVARLTARPALDWTRPVHGDGDGWDAKDLLAHLSSTQSALAGVVAAPAAGDSAAERAPFDADRWNASQLRRRKERRPSELAEEMRTGAERLHAALMSVDLAGGTGAGPYAGRPAAEAMEQMLEHQRGHLAELGRALQA